MGYNFFTLYYGYYIGMAARGTIGKKYVYQVVNNRQWKRRWVKPKDPKTPGQLNMRFLFACAVAAWHDLTDPEKLSWKDVNQGTKIYSGYNAFLSSYIKSFL